MSEGDGDVTNRMFNWIDQQQLWLRLPLTIMYLIGLVIVLGLLMFAAVWL